MVKHLSLVAIMALMAIMCHAQSAEAILDKAVATIKSSGGVTASYSVSSKQGSGKGTIAMDGVKFRILSGEALKSWYNGTDQWTYTKATGEVNLSTPTAADLEMTNPYAAANSFKKNFKMKSVTTKLPGFYSIRLIPIKKGNIASLYLYIDKKTNLIRIANFTMSDKSQYTINIFDYKTHVNLPASTFNFDSKLVPSGTEVVDLR